MAMGSKGAYPDGPMTWAGAPFERFRLGVSRPARQEEPASDSGSTLIATLRPRRVSLTEVHLAHAASA